MSTRPFPSRLRLSRGESVHLELPRGLRLVNLGGTVKLGAAPRTLSGMLHAPAWVLEGGSTHRVEDGGWMRLQALQDADLVLLAPEPSAWQRLMARWHRSVLRPAGLSASR